MIWFEKIWNLSQDSWSSLLLLNKRFNSFFLNQSNDGSNLQQIVPEAPISRTIACELCAESRRQRKADGQTEREKRQRQRGGGGGGTKAELVMDTRRVWRTTIESTISNSISLIARVTTNKLQCSHKNCLSNFEICPQQARYSKPTPSVVNFAQD